MTATNGTLGVKKGRAANRLDYTLNPSDMDYTEVKEYHPYPKMIFKGDGITADDQKVVMDEAELTRALAQGWRMTAVPQEPEPLMASVAESAVAPLKKRGRPAKTETL